MNIEHRKKKIISEIENLSEEQMITLENFFLEILEKKQGNKEIKSIIIKDFSRFKETFKALS